MRMKKTALHKDIYRTITGTLPRFLSIFFIVVLGVAFYSGIRVTQKVCISQQTTSLMEVG